jgi:hypothetical protein
LAQQQQRQPQHLARFQAVDLGQDLADQASKSFSASSKHASRALRLWTQPGSACVDKDF